MEKYSSYKDSGVKWLGEIPSHWDVISLKHLANISSGSTPSSSVEKYWNGNVRWITPADFKTETKYVSCGIRNITEEGVSACSTVVLPQNSVVFSKRAPVGQVSITTEELCVNQGCIACVPNSKVISTFLYYLLSVYRNEFDFFSVGTTFREISLKEFSSFKVSVPSILEQELIVKYLDSATSQIDTAISQQKKMIELLNERKQIIINNAVTKGLDPNVKMKDSGVDWIGEIPEGWEVKKLKHVTSKIGSGSTPRGGADVYTDYGVRFLRSQNVYNDGLRLSDVAYIADNVHVKMKGTQVRENDILYNITGGSIGRCCCYTDDKEANVNQHVSIVRPFGIVPKFLMFSLQSSNAQRQLRITLKGGNREGLAAESFKEFLIVVPTLNDQKKIVADIESKFVTINNAIDVTNNQITLLQERKQIIINEVVTGKVKVS